VHDSLEVNEYLVPRWTSQELGLGRLGPNLEHGTMRVYVTSGPQNGLDIGKGYPIARIFDSIIRLPFRPPVCMLYTIQY